MMSPNHHTQFQQSACVRTVEGYAYLSFFVFFSRRIPSQIPARISGLAWIFFLKVLGWHLPGISGGPTSTPPPCITCGTVQLFFCFLLSLYCFCFCSFCQLFLGFSAAYCKFGFSANAILNLSAIFSSFLSSKLNLPFPSNFPPVY